MRASQAAAQAPQPLPLPLPPPPLYLPSPPPAPRRGRHRAFSSSSSSSSSVSSAASSFYSCPSPSPATSPRASTASLVPFSWERHPGVPKNSFRGGLVRSPTGAPLPLPPPLRPAPRRRRRRRANVTVAAASSGPGTNNSDPFVAAFAECTREADDEGTDHGADADVPVADRLWLARTKQTSSSVRAERRWWLFGFLDLYGCKSAMAVADGAFLARRPVVAHGRPSRR